MTDRSSIEKYLAQATTIGLTRGAFSHCYAGLINWEFYLQKNPFFPTNTFFSTTPLARMMVGTSSIFWRNSRELFRGVAWETGTSPVNTSVKLMLADCVFNGLMDGTGLTQITKGQGFFQSLSSFFGNQTAVTKLSRNIQVAGLHSVWYWYIFIESGRYYDEFLSNRFGSFNNRTNYFEKCLWVGSVTTLGVIPLNHYKNLYMAGHYGQTSLYRASVLHAQNLSGTFIEKGFLAAIKHSFRGTVPYGIANLMTFGTVEAGKTVRRYIEQRNSDRSIGG